MPHEGRASRNSPDTTAEHVSRDGVVSAAGAALVTTFARPEIVTRIDVGDPDAFDDDGCLVYEAGNE